MSTSYQKYQLKEVINASGKMTILGVSKVSKNVQAAQNEGGSHFYEMAELSQQTGRFIAQLLGVEASIIVSSASAGIAQSVAAMIGQGDLYHLYHPYSPKITRREIVIPKGHNVDYGAPVELMIEQGGGQVVEAGYANQCRPEHLVQMINANTAAVFYVKSHHAVQKSMLSVAEAIEVAHAHRLPLIVDAAAEEDLQKYVQLGADLVIYSGAKAIEGPSSGLVIGKKEYIEWVRLQQKGLGRSMKIGKENILGLTQAISDYMTVGSESGCSMKERLRPFIAELNQIDNITAKEVRDSAGREIYRAQVLITGELSASQVVAALKQQSPAIYTREYQVNNGIIEFDIRAVTAEEMSKISQRLREIMEGSGKK